MAFPLSIDGRSAESDASFPVINPATGDPFYGRWVHDAFFTGKGGREARYFASRGAHEYARYLRKTYPCSYVGVTEVRDGLARMPMPIGSQAVPEPAGRDFADFGASWLGL